MASWRNRPKQPPKPKPLRSYHFSGGNSTTGPVGFCARVRAHSKKEACEILASAMPEEEYQTGIAVNDDEGRIEYFNFYLNSGAVKPRMIDEVEDVQLCPGCDEELTDENTVGCPDGAEICRACFNQGAH